MTLTPAQQLVVRQCGLCGHDETVLSNGQEKAVGWYPNRVPIDTHCRHCDKPGLMLNDYHLWRPKPDYNPKEDAGLRDKKAGRPPNLWYTRHGLTVPRSANRPQPRSRRNVVRGWGTLLAPLIISVLHSYHANPSSAN